MIICNYITILRVYFSATEIRQQQIISLVSSNFYVEIMIIQIKTSLFNTFASQRLVFEEKNEPFLYENASSLTHDFLYDNFNNKIFLLKLLYKIHVSNLMHIQFFFFLKEALLSKIINFIYKLIHLKNILSFMLHYIIIKLFL